MKEVCQPDFEHLCRQMVLAWDASGDTVYEFMAAARRARHALGLRLDPDEDRDERLLLTAEGYTVDE